MLNGVLRTAKLKSAVSFAILAVVSILFHNCSFLGGATGKAEEASVELTPDQTIQRILKSEYIVLELEINFPAGAVETQIFTATLTVPTNQLSVDNSAIARGSNTLVSACLNNYNGDESTEIVVDMTALKTGGSTRLNTDNINSELTISDLSGNSVRLYLAGSPAAQGQQVVFLNADSLALKISGLGGCSVTP